VAVVYTLERMRVLAGACIVLLAARSPASAQHGGAGKLTYGVEWRLIRAGTATLEYQKTHATLRLESGGIVSALMKILDTYDADYQDSYCAVSSVMDSKEGKRHHDTRVTYDYSRNRAFFVEKDLARNAVIRQTGVDIPNCASDAVGALLNLRGMNTPLGQAVRLPVSDGRRFAQVKVEAQEREQIKTSAGMFNTVRYEADLMNGVIYSRKGHVHIWLTDDPRRLPVQIRLQLSFPVGTVTLALEKEEYP